MSHNALGMRAAPSSHKHQRRRRRAYGARASGALGVAASSARLERGCIGISSPRARARHALAHLARETHRAISRALSICVKYQNKRMRRRNGRRIRNGVSSAENLMAGASGAQRRRRIAGNKHRAHRAENKNKQRRQRALEGGSHLHSHHQHHGISLGIARAARNSSRAHRRRQASTSGCAAPSCRTTPRGGIGASPLLEITSAALYRSSARHRNIISGLAARPQTQASASCG